MSLPAIRFREVAALSATLGFLTGILDGLQLALTRDVPTLLSPYKVSLDILWIDPVVTTVAYGLAGVGLLPVLGVAARRGLDSRRVLCAALAALSVGLLTVSLRVIHPAAALVLALGAAAAMWQTGTERWNRVCPALRRYGLMVAVSWVTIPVIVWGADRVRVSRRLAALPEVTDRPPNVLMLILDTVRRDRFYRPDGRVLAPRLEGLRGDAIWFPNAWSTSSWSLPSHASLLTGRLPDGHGADFPGVALRPGVPTLAALLEARGYATAAFSGNAAWVTPEHLGPGFAVFQSYHPTIVARRTAVGRVLNPLLIAVGLHGSADSPDADEVIGHFRAFRRRIGERPFLAYLVLMDVNRGMHEAQLARAAWRPPATVDEVVAAYDASLSALDRELTRFLQEMEASGDLDRTMLVVTSDHGESFGAGYARDHDPAGHGSSLYPEQVRVPLWIRLPGRALASEILPEPVSLADVPATILAEIGHAPALQGSSLLRRAAGPRPPVHLTLQYPPRRMHALVHGDTLLIETEAPPPARIEPFHLAGVADVLRDTLLAIEPPAGLLRMLRAGDVRRSAAPPPP